MTDRPRYVSTGPSSGSEPSYLVLDTGNRGKVVAYLPSREEADAEAARLNQATDDELERLRKENVERRKRLRRELEEDDGA